MPRDIDTIPEGETPKRPAKPKHPFVCDNCKSVKQSSQKLPPNWDWGWGLGVNEKQFFCSAKCQELHDERFLSDTYQMTGEKYAGVKMSDIDRNYLEWVLDNKDDNKRSILYHACSAELRRRDETRRQYLREWREQENAQTTSGGISSSGDD